MPDELGQPSTPPESPEPSLGRRLKNLLIGEARSPHDRSMFHKISLIAFFAWVGLGADGLSSSCYGPPEAFAALKGHPYLGIFVALATVLTIFVISQSYRQIIELFPTGGGGYLVASKLLSPRTGMVAGCALLVDYVLTISVSVASGVEAMFSFFPPGWVEYRLSAGVVVILLLLLMNLRGVKESVGMLMPIFLVFVFSHIFAIGYTLTTHITHAGMLASQTAEDISRARSELGLFGMIFIIMHAYSMGAGTFTGIEAVSNGLPMLREPRVETGKRTMTYMWVSLSVVVIGLMLSYLLLNVHPDPKNQKTLNAIMLETLSGGWNSSVSKGFVIVTLVSEAALLFVAAQTGFIGGPSVLANMALDRWFPARFSMLSDRFVAQNGVLIMSIAAGVTMILTRGSVTYLLTLYSINVFITFLLSQTGMVRHWWEHRTKVSDWRRKLFINGVGMAMTLFILCWIIVGKFFEGGWVTLVVTGSLILIVSLIHRYYSSVRPLAERLNKLTGMVEMAGKQFAQASGRTATSSLVCDTNAKTAVVLVSGFNGFGIHTLLNIIRTFGDTFRNFVFVEVGLLDAGNFKGASEIEALKKHVKDDLDRYIEFCQSNGYYAEGFSDLGTDVSEELEKIAPKIMRRFPQAVFFAGQLVFPKDSILTRWLHNNIVFAVQRRLYRQGISFVILPIRV